MAEYVKRYNPNRSPDWNYGGAKWKLSRAKIDLFFECPRCFYLDNKLGTKRPNIPSFNLNLAVDELFKKEFDYHRKNGTSHPLQTAYEIDAIPFAHDSLDAWRDPFVGIMHQHEATGLLVSGGVDDIWVNSSNELIVVDYKATAKPTSLTTLEDSPWEAQYRRQIGVYQWLLAQNGFTVHPVGYFVYANAKQSVERFADRLEFETTVIPCEGSNEWMDKTLHDIYACLEADVYPDSGEGCEYCAYRTACGQKLQRIYANQKSNSETQ
jgi:hypothetical protein